MDLYLFRRSQKRQSSGSLSVYGFLLNGCILSCLTCFLEEILHWSAGSNGS